MADYSKLRKFQSTPPVWGATRLHDQPYRTRPHFNPRPPCGGRPAVRLCIHCAVFRFQSTPPVWGATNTAGMRRSTSSFQSTPPVWGATKSRPNAISASVFQSTPPVWGATAAEAGDHGRDQNFNPRPPCGGRLATLFSLSCISTISIHAPRVGGDFLVCGGGRDHRHISIHAPRVGGDQCLRFRRYLVCISIHAPRVGGDPSWPISRSAPRYFNPRPPCGGRPFSFLQPCPSRGLFQSTPPVWGATLDY